MDNPLKYFAELRDPRVERNLEHLLEEILLISIAAVLRGAESWNGIADCGGGQARVAANLLDASVGHSIARYVQPGVCGAGSIRTRWNRTRWNEALRRGSRRWPLA
ncbi:MAG: transposase family protein [Acidobacteriaceae bacterium]